MVSSLSGTLTTMGDDIRVCLPAYRGTRQLLSNVTHRGSVSVVGNHFDVLQGTLPQTNQTIVLLDCPDLFDRAGDPYRDQTGREFSDNGWRFGCFNLAVTQLIKSGFGGWRPDLIHLHDWHTGLVPALLKLNSEPTPTLFTVHNFSFHGVFPRVVFDALKLPPQWWDPERIEFYQQFSFMKAALLYADRVTAVSPRYAQEMHSEEFGCGLEGVVQRYSDRISGILNGIDVTEWNPLSDIYLEKNYSGRNVVGGKTANKTAIQHQLGLPKKSVPLFVVISRLAHQKGMDLLLTARDTIDKLPLQLVVLGRGEQEQEEAFQGWSRDNPEKVATVIDVDERFAHRLTAAADFQIMPSRFEPCGLSQMYAQRYGTLPVARATGGLADTIVNATDIALADGSATGFLFENATTDELVEALKRALDLWQAKRDLNRMRRAAMTLDFSWHQSANAYRNLYHALVHKDGAKVALSAAG